MAIFRFSNRVIVPTEKKYGYINGKKYINIDYISSMSASSLGWSSGTEVNGAIGESDPCSGLVTFQQALQHAHDQGARLPTLYEAIGNVAGGTGCSYDYEMIWTCTKGNTSDEHWIVKGLDGAGTEVVLANYENAYVRMVADIDINRNDPVNLEDAVIYNFLRGV